MTQDIFIIRTLKGFKIPFVSVPVQLMEPAVKNISASETQILSSLVAEYEKLGAISESNEEEGQFVSNIFSTPKSDGSYRLIFNLAPLNEFIDCPHFKLEDYRNVRALIARNDYMAKIDIKHAYFHVPVAVEFRKYLKFRFNSKLYEFTSLPFGLSLAPWLFSKLMKPVVTYLRDGNFINSIFLDDIWLAGSNYENCKANVVATIGLLESLGFVVNYEKSITDPCRVIEYLGLIFDSERFLIRLPEKKMTKILKMCEAALQWSEVSTRRVSVLLGTLISACPGMTYGLLYTRHIALDVTKALGWEKNYEAPMRLSAESVDDLRWWKSNILQASQIIRQDKYNLTIYTDSSRTGWGAKCANKTAYGFWNFEQKRLHINILELLAVEKGLQTFVKSDGISVLLRVDNITAISYVNRMGGCHCPRLLEVATRIWKWCESRNLWLFASYIKSKHNSVADFESRRAFVSDDWCLRKDIFMKLCTQLRVPDIDLFATDVSTQCGRFISFRPCPGAAEIDAFTVNWNGLNFYAFPPFVMIPRVLRKIENDRATGILVVPKWPSQSWYPKFVTMCHSKLIEFGPRDDMIYCPYSNRFHPLHKQLRLVAAIVSHQC